MKKIGLVTTFSGNYGSILQCYASKTTLEKLGYNCTVFSSRLSGKERVFNWGKRLYRLITNTVLFGNMYLKDYLELKQRNIHTKNYLIKEANPKMEFFIKTRIQPTPASNKLLRYLAHKDEYIAFLTGSDQVWNCSWPINEFYFLNFAPHEKRIALSPSFGTGIVKNYNKKIVNKYINSFKAISVREDEGIKIIKDLSGLSVKKLADPTILLTKEEWIRFSDNGFNELDDFILLHFIDAPNAIALKCIHKLAESNPCTRFVCFSYAHSEFEKLDNCITIAGTPQDYISLINRANIVLTDSFHTTSFSIYLQKSFYTFNREYQHNNPETGRLTSLLALYELSDRLVESPEASLKCGILPDCSELINEERKKLFDYLKEILDFYNTENEAQIPNIKSSNACCGCALCVTACPKHAISMVTTEYGYAVPYINKNLCVKCGICEKLCNAQKANEGVKHAFVACIKNEKMRKRAASGGVFAALGEYVINKNGIVYGSALLNINGEIVVRHERIDSINDLPQIMQSKYVQSDCQDVYKRIELDLQQDKTVLFGGTPCQINALYSFLDDELTKNLYTVDIICHGVPGKKLFADYIKYLEQKYNGKIEEFTFRQKNACNGMISYSERFIVRKMDGKFESVLMPYTLSPYYRMFLGQESYREQCYSCKYSSLNRPADITVGDYFELSQDYPNLANRIKNKDINCVIVHNNKGIYLLNKVKDNLILENVDVPTVQKSHGNLCSPSNFSYDRVTLFKEYKKGGFKAVESFYRKRDRLYKIVNFARNKK